MAQQITLEQINNHGSIRIVTESGTARTLSLTDAGKYIRCTSGSATAITVPANASIAIPVEQTIAIRQAGAGLVTIVADGGVTINPPYGGTLVSAGNGSLMQLVKVATDTWDLVGQTANA
jgi:hypothetical protein